MRSLLIAVCSILFFSLTNCTSKTESLLEVVFVDGDTIHIEASSVIVDNDHELWFRNSSGTGFIGHIKEVKYIIPEERCQSISR